MDYDVLEMMIEIVFLLKKTSNFTGAALYISWICINNSKTIILKKKLFKLIM